MDLQCVACRVGLPFLPAGVYWLSSAQLICQSCYESGVTQVPVLYDLLSDPLVFHVRTLIQGLSNSTSDTNAARFLYQQALKALEMRMQELGEVPQSITPGGEAQEGPVDDGKWQCPHCGYRNIATNPICWQCRLSPTDAARPINVDMVDLPLLLTVHAQDKTSTDQWKCPKCENSHPFTQVTCYCGYVNLELVSSSVRSVEEDSKVPVVATPGSGPQSVCWTCECSYEYNLNTAESCGKCGKARSGGDKTPPLPGLSVNSSDQVTPSSPPAQGSSDGRTYHPRAAKNAPEWICLTCKRKNSEVKNTCGLCGAPRPVKRCEECLTPLVNGACPKHLDHRPT